MYDLIELVRRWLVSRDANARRKIAEFYWRITMNTTFGHRLSRFLLLPAILLVGCASIRVNPDDVSPPTVSFYLPPARARGATYSDGSAVSLSDPLDSTRHFRINVVRDNEPVALLVAGTDRESGIASTSGYVEASFDCTFRDAGETYTQHASYRLSGNTNHPAHSGATVSANDLVLISFTLEDLWRNGHCGTWQEHKGFDFGTISDIQLGYAGIAVNNAVPTLISPTTPPGTFSIEGTHEVVLPVI